MSDRSALAISASLAERPVEILVGGGDEEPSVSPVAADGKIYAVSEEGKVAVIRAGAQWELLGVSDLGDGSKSTPAITGGKIYIRTYGTLYCFAEGRSEETPVPAQR